VCVCPVVVVVVVVVVAAAAAAVVLYRRNQLMFIHCYLYLFLSMHFLFCQIFSEIKFHGSIEAVLQIISLLSASKLIRSAIRPDIYDIA
jgi:hypothetical protein